MKKTKYQVGDTVKRVKNGRHGKFDEDVPFKVHGVNHDGVVDEYDYTHSYMSIKLVAPLEPIIINQYEIY